MSLLLFHRHFMRCVSRHHPVRCFANVSLRGLRFQNHPRFLSINLHKTPSATVLFALDTSGFRSHRRMLPIARDIHVAPLGEETNITKRFELMEAKLKKAGIKWDHVPGQFSAMMCPKCEGGRKQERSFSLFVRDDGKIALWRCHRGKCGWTGIIQDRKDANIGKQRLKAKQIRVITENELQVEPPCGEVVIQHRGKCGWTGTIQDRKDANIGKQPLKAKQIRVITENELQLEPPCDEIRGYFQVRGITFETLRRNAVLQRRYKDRTVIAFTYRRDGVLVSCKYRGVPKTFWQEHGTERIFYGLDDIKHASDIIIVEGEIDKLSMEEAGYRNCVSVPCGASVKISKVLPREEQDTSFQYLWNCKKYLDKASRIILATDADDPGQALAEEIARRVGKERCWRVNWPMKFNTAVCKDANEVLMYKGKDALKEVIENAEFYPIPGLSTFSSFSSEIDNYYHGINENGQSVSTGWRDFE